MWTDTVSVKHSKARSACDSVGKLLTAVDYSVLREGKRMQVAFELFWAERGEAVGLSSSGHRQARDTCDWESCSM